MCAVTVPKGSVTLLHQGSDGVGGVLEDGKGNLYQYVYNADATSKAAKALVEYVVSHASFLSCNGALVGNVSYGAPNNSRLGIVTADGLPASGYGFVQRGGVAAVSIQLGAGSYAVGERLGAGDSRNRASKIAAFSVNSVAVSVSNEGFTVHVAGYPYLVLLGQSIASTTVDTATDVSTVTAYVVFRNNQ